VEGLGEDPEGGGELVVGHLDEEGTLGPEGGFDGADSPGLVGDLGEADTPGLAGGPGEEDNLGLGGDLGEADLSLAGQAAPDAYTAEQLAG